MIIEALKLLLIKIFLLFWILVPQKTLVVGLEGSINTLVPSEIKSDNEKIISSLIYRKLFEYHNGELSEDLIKNWEISPDKKIYKYELKSDANWQDGSPITTDDVIFSLSQNKELINQLDIEKLSDKKFTITLSAPNAILNSILTFGIQPANASEDNKFKQTGSTSYHVAYISSENNSVSSVTLQSFQKDKMYPRIIFKFYKNNENLKTAYKLGEINAFISPNEFKWENSTQIPVTYQGRYFALISNTTSEKVADLEVRKTLSKSLDIENFRLKSLNQGAIRTIGPISRTKYTKNNLLRNPFDPTADLSPSQKSTLNEISLLVPNNQESKQIESFISADWNRNLGIKVNTSFMDEEDFVDEAKSGKYDVILVGHETSIDPDRYSFWHSTQIGQLNIGKFSDPKLDKALEEGRKYIKYEERLPHYAIMQDVFEQKAPAIFLYHPGTYLYTKKNREINIPSVIFTPADIFAEL